MKNNYCLALLVLALAMGACSPGKKSVENPSERGESQSNITPFSFPDAPTSAKAGEWVLAPPERIVQAAQQKKKFFTYYRRKVSKVGPKASQVKIKGTEEKIPNTLMIPLGSQQNVEPGDIILTSNLMDNHSMARGIVAEGGTPQEPLFHYLEIRELSRLDNRKFKLQPGTFKVLKTPGEPGSELVCKNKESFRGVTLVNSNDTHYLTKTSLGAIEVYDKADCHPISLRPQVYAGDKVYVPIGAFYREGKVTKVEDRLGRLYVEYPFGKLIKERAFPYGVVATIDPARAMVVQAKPQRK